MSLDPAGRPTFQQLALVLKASVAAWKKLDAGPGGPNAMLPPPADGCNDGVCLRPVPRSKSAPRLAAQQHAA